MKKELAFGIATLVIGAVIALGFSYATALDDTAVAAPVTGDVPWYPFEDGCEPPNTYWMPGGGPMSDYDRWLSHQVAWELACEVPTCLSPWYRVGPCITASSPLYVQPSDLDPMWLPPGVTPGRPCDIITFPGFMDTGVDCSAPPFGEWWAPQCDPDYYDECTS